MTPGALPHSGGVSLTTAGIGELASQVERAGMVAVAIDPSASGPFSTAPRFLGFAVPSSAPVVLDLSRPSALAPLACALRRAHAVVHGPGAARELLRLGLKPAAFHDTELAARLLDAGRTKDDGDFALEVFDREVGSRGRVASTAFGPPGPSAHARVARATIATLAAADILDDRIYEASLVRVFKLECELLPVLLAVQSAGVPIDGTAWAVYLDSQSKIASSLRESILRGLNVRSLEDPGLVLDAVRDLVGPVDNSKKLTLMPYIGHPGIADLIEYRRASAFLKSPGEAVLDAIARSADGRVRAEFRQIGSPTGRMSSARPNLMGLPKCSAVRACITPGQGRSLIVADYSTIDLRVLADRIREPRFLVLFAQGGDAHQITAARLYGKSADAVTDGERQVAKAVNFGVVFGMGASGLVDYARGVYGIRLTLPAAAAFLEAFLAHFQGVRDWHEETKRSCPTLVRTGSGRMRYFGVDPSAYCARLNTGVQGTTSDGLKRAMILLAPRLKPFGAQMILTIHDEVLVDSPTIAAREVKDTVVDAMCEGMQEFVQSVPIVVKASVRDSWARGAA